MATTSIQVHEASLIGLEKAMSGQTLRTQKTGPAHEGAMAGQAQPVIMPIIVNAADGKVGGGNYPQNNGIDLGDAHKLKDMISQAVSDQFQLH